SLGRMWAADTEQATLIEDGRRALKLQRRRTHETSRPSPLLTGRNGQLWFLGESIRGLSSGIEFKDRADHDRFAPISGFEDSRGHLWLASLGQGLVEWIPEAKWNRWFPEDLAGEPMVKGVRAQDGALILATQRNLYRLSAAADRWAPMTNHEYRFEALFPLKSGGFLASIRQLGVVRLSPEGEVVERLQDIVPAKQEYREITQDSKGRYWVGAKRALLRIE